MPHVVGDCCRNHERGYTPQAKGLAACNTRKGKNNHANAQHQHQHQHGAPGAHCDMLRTLAEDRGIQQYAYGGR